MLDLKILSDFTRGDVIVAGDDFRSLDKVDLNAAAASNKAEQLFGGGGMALKRTLSDNIIGPQTKVEVFPIGPGSAEEGVNVDPTAGNIERFYEGNYYNFMGQARPEGGQFNLKFVMKVPKGDYDIKFKGEHKETKFKRYKWTRKEFEAAGKAGELTGRDKLVYENKGQSILYGENGKRIVVDDSDKYSNKSAGFFADVGASEGRKMSSRLAMFDGDTETFWECEYVYDSTALIKPFDDMEVDPGEDNTGKGQDDNAPRGASTTIDIKKAEQVALEHDLVGRDLTVDVVVTFPEVRAVNYVVIDPVIFGSTAFPVIQEIATAGDEGQFIVVDGWDANNYAKSITPEANEFLTDTQVGQLLAPDRFSYTGKGVFPFPVREAKKVRIRLFVDNPVPSAYERYYILLRQQIQDKVEVKTITRRHGLRKYCWVAREVIPNRWTDVRAYMMNGAPNWLYSLYGTYGEQFAGWIHNKPVVKLLLKPLFLYFAWRGKKWQK